MTHPRSVLRSASSVAIPTLLVGAVVLLGGCAGRRGTAGQIPAPQEAAAPPPVRPTAIDPALQAAARAELDRGLASNDADVRAHAIEALAQTVGESAKSAYLNRVRDAAAQE